MLKLDNISEPDLGESRLGTRSLNFTHPEGVLHSTSLSVEEKRAILAGWASDAHALPNVPSMRQLDSGAIISLDVILSSLRALDDIERAGKGKSQATLSRKRKIFWRAGKRRSDNDDDDDPPPCPAAASLRLPRLGISDHVSEMQGVIAA